MWFDKDDKNADEEPMRETTVIPDDWLTPKKGSCHWPPQFKDSVVAPN